MLGTTISSLASPSISLATTPTGQLPAAKLFFNANEIVPGTLVFKKQVRLLGPFTEVINSGLPSPFISRTVIPVG